MAALLLASATAARPRLGGGTPPAALLPVLANSSQSQLVPSQYAANLENVGHTYSNLERRPLTRPTTWARRIGYRNTMAIVKTVKYTSSLASAFLSIAINTVIFGPEFALLMGACAVMPWVSAGLMLISMGVALYSQYQKLHETELQHRLSCYQYMRTRLTSLQEGWQGSIKYAYAAHVEVEAQRKRLKPALPALPARVAVLEAAKSEAAEATAAVCSGDECADLLGQETEQIVAACAAAAKASCAAACCRAATFVDAAIDDAIVLADVAAASPSGVLASGGTLSWVPRLAAQLARRIAHAERALQLLQAPGAWHDATCPDEEGPEQDAQARSKLAQWAARARREAAELRRVGSAATKQQQALAAEISAVLRRNDFSAAPPVHTARIAPPADLEALPPPDAPNLRRSLERLTRRGGKGWDAADGSVPLPDGAALERDCTADAARRKELQTTIARLAMHQVARDLAFAYRTVKETLIAWGQEGAQPLMKQVSALSEAVEWWQQHDEARDKLSATERKIYSTLDFVTGLLSLSASATDWTVFKEGKIFQKETWNRLLRPAESDSSAPGLLGEIHDFFNEVKDHPIVDSSKNLLYKGLYSNYKKGKGLIKGYKKDKAVTNLVHQAQGQYAQQFEALLTAPPPHTELALVAPARPVGQNLTPKARAAYAEKLKAHQALVRARRQAEDQEALSFAMRYQQQLEQVSGAAGYACCFGEEVARWRAKKGDKKQLGLLGIKTRKRVGVVLRGAPEAAVVYGNGPTPCSEFVAEHKLLLPTSWHNCGQPEYIVQLGKHKEPNRFLPKGEHHFGRFSLDYWMAEQWKPNARLEMKRRWVVIKLDPAYRGTNKPTMNKPTAKKMGHPFKDFFLLMGSPEEAKAFVKAVAKVRADAFGHGAIAHPMQVAAKSKTWQATATIEQSRTCRKLIAEPTGGVLAYINSKEGPVFSADGRRHVKEALVKQLGATDNAGVEPALATCAAIVSAEDAQEARIINDLTAFKDRQGRGIAFESSATKESLQQQLRRASGSAAAKRVAKALLASERAREAEDAPSQALERARLLSEVAASGAPTLESAAQQPVDLEGTSSQSYHSPAALEGAHAQSLESTSSQSTPQPAPLPPSDRRPIAGAFGELGKKALAEVAAAATTANFAFSADAEQSFSEVLATVQSWCDDSRATFHSAACHEVYYSLAKSMTCQVDLTSPCEDVKSSSRVPVTCGQYATGWFFGGEKGMGAGINTCGDRHTSLSSTPLPNTPQKPTDRAAALEEFKCVTPGGKPYPGATAPEARCQDMCSTAIKGGGELEYDPTLKSDGTNLVSLWRASQEGRTTTTQPASFQRGVDDYDGTDPKIIKITAEGVRDNYVLERRPSEQSFRQRKVWWGSEPKLHPKPFDTPMAIKSIEPLGVTDFAHGHGKTGWYLAGWITVVPASEIYEGTLSHEHQLRFRNPKRARSPVTTSLPVVSPEMSVWELRDYVHDMEQACSSAKLGGVPSSWMSKRSLADIRAQTYSLYATHAVPTDGRAVDAQWESVFAEAMADLGTDVRWVEDGTFPCEPTIDPEAFLQAKEDLRR